MGNAQRIVDGASPEATAEAGLPSDSTGQGQGSPSLAERVVGSYRAVMKFLGRRALARATLAVPRTLRFMGAAARSGEVSDGLAAPPLSLGFAAGVAMDEALLAMAMTPNRFPSTGRLRSSERRARRRPSVVLEARLDRSARLLSPHPTPARCQGCRDEPRVGTGPGLRADHLRQRVLDTPRRARWRAVDGLRAQPSGDGCHRPSPRGAAPVGRVRTRVLHGLPLHGLHGPADRQAAP